MLLQLIGIGVSIYGLMLLVRGMMIWLNVDKTQSGVQFFTRMTEPVLAPLRAFFPNMGFDVSPIAAIVILWLANWLLVSLIVSLTMPAAMPVIRY